jgi:hypothetical protein
MPSLETPSDGLCMRSDKAKELFQVTSEHLASIFDAGQNENPTLRELRHATQTLRSLRHIACGS